MKSMISAAALGLLFALAGMIAASQTFADDGAVGGGDVSTLSAGDSGDQQSANQYDNELRAQIPDIMSNPSRNGQLMNGIRRELGKDNKTVETD